MKKIILILLILISSITINYAQKNYIDYHKNLVKAKIALIDSNYTGSLKIFNETFNEYGFVFIRDCFLATQVACYVKNDSLTFHFLEIAVQHGLMVETIKNDKLLSTLQENKQWNNFLGSYDSLRNIYIHSINWDLRMKCFDMFIKDQEPRFRSDKWYNIPFRSRFIRNAEELNQKQVLVLKEFLKKYGFPSNKLIGIGDNTIYKLNSNESLTNLFAVVILYHSTNTWNDLNEILFECVKRGELDPNYYAKIKDFDEIHNEKNLRKRKPYYNYLGQNENYNEKEIDEHRQEIGILTKSQNTKLLKVYTKLGFKYFVSMF